MSSLIGQLGLWGAIAAAIWTLSACAAGWGRDSAWWRTWGRVGLLLMSAAATASGAALVWALVRGDFFITYVAAHTELALPVPLRVAAFWAGEQGSLLLWAVMVAALAASFTLARRQRPARGDEVAIAVFACVGLLLLGLVAVAANPFAVGLPAPTDGRGLHPQLQYWAMIAHPPVLFLGYAASVGPVAIVCGALAAGRADADWLVPLRRWAIASWLLLGLGIVLGARWAYVELGWGGFWAWDPVENAALLPWLSATGLIHSIGVHRRRGVLKGWTAGLAVATFVLALMGAAITRSGAIQSVHGFAGSSTGWPLALFAGAAAAGAGGLLTWRRDLLAPRIPITHPVSREGASLLANLLLSAMVAAVLVGTCFPILSRMVAPAPIGIAPSFYLRTVAPLGLALLVLMSVGPLLAYGRATIPRSWLALAAGAAVLAALLGVAAGFTSPTVVLCLAIVCTVIGASLLDAAREVRGFARASGFGILAATARVVDSNHRRYGGQLAHAGAAVLVLGAAGAGLLHTSTIAAVHPGDTFLVGSHTLQFEGLQEERREDHTAVQACVRLFDEAGMPSLALRPERRLYDRFGEAAPKVALAGSWREDLYLSLSGWEAGGTQATFDARVNPLMIWFWIGAGLMGVGGVFAVTPRLAPRPRAEATARAGMLETATSQRPAPWCHPALVARSVTAQVDGRTILSNIGFSVEPGTITALLGPNGAGKSTLLRALGALIRLEAGSVEWFGGSGPERRARIGFIGHDTMLYRDLTVMQNLSFFARLYGVPRPAEAALAVMVELGLDGCADERVGALSRGTAQRAAIARALVHGPDLLLADEPLTGLDSAWSARVESLLLHLKDRGITTVLAHHDIGQALGIADRVLILDHGRLILDAPTQGLEAGHLVRTMEGRA